MYISIGRSRKDIHWQVKDITWYDLCNKLSNTLRTTESVAEYKAMSKDEKAVRKDVGGFVGGVISGGRRTKGNVKSRSLITLDADFATSHTWSDCELLLDFAMCCYSTHSHTPHAPRLRFVIPLNREVTPEEYEPIARMVAADIGIDIFDVTTYETSRLMYWPSTPEDGEFIFEELKGEILDADEVLSRYTNWRDTTEWPLGETETTVRAKQAKAQGDPESKPGLVGAFCRTYDIPAVIDAYLSEEYTLCDDGSGRYTYTHGSTSAGMVLYNNGRFAYSHHSTDPACGILCNAFDLVRIHKYGILDEGKSKDTEVTKLPSYKEMCKLVQSDVEVKKHLVSEGLEQAKEVFGDSFFEVNWAEKLKTSKQGVVESTTDNVVLILENDENFKGCLAKNIFTGRLSIVKDLPWRDCDDKANGSNWTDSDDSNLRLYFEQVYNISNSSKITDGLVVVMNRNAYHPVQNYLRSLKWDGIKRGEKLFIHYMGAEDNHYTRTVTRKWLTAAVARAMVPGIKFDNLVVLVGAQGIGKSYLGKMLGRGWFSDTFSTVQGKDAYEQLQGRWVIEIGELSAMKRAEVESVKQFISKQSDDFRAAYGRYSECNKRQCVFYGTTNDTTFLRDNTGNRRFWPIAVDKANAMYDVFELTDENMDQIWAEAVTWFNNGETLYLDAKTTELALDEQSKFMTVDPRQGEIEDYLDKPLPANWYDLDKTSRRNYIQGFTQLTEGEETIQRDYVSVAELAYELYGEGPLDSFKAKDYHSMLTAVDGWKKTGKRKRGVYGQQPVYERMD